MISPQDFEHLVKHLAEAFREAEIEILEKIARTLDKGSDDPAIWQQQKLADLRKNQVIISQIIKKLTELSDQEIAKILSKSYIGGLLSADSDLVDAGQDLLEELVEVDLDEVTGIDAVRMFGGTHTEALAVMIGEAQGLIHNELWHILRSTNDKYRKIIAETSRLATMGVDTRRQATQKAIIKFAQNGIATFTDKRGRNWDIASYAEMATRASTGNAAIQGSINRLAQHGYDLVIVSDHAEECERCRPWERKVLSISGTHPRYKSVRDARSAGLFHPGCGHVLGAYFPGITKPPRGRTADPRGYENRQKQRELERMVRKWKKREAIAITDEEKAKSRAKIREYQGKLREFTKEAGRPRDYWREQVR